MKYIVHESSGTLGAGWKENPTWVRVQSKASDECPPCLSEKNSSMFAYGENFKAEKLQLVPIWKRSAGSLPRFAGKRMKRWKSSGAI